MCELFEFICIYQVSPHSFLSYFSPFTLLPAGGPRDLSLSRLLEEARCSNTGRPVGGEASPELRSRQQSVKASLR